VAASAVRPDPLIVVDNGTGALDAAMVEGAELIALPANTGFAGGSNVGLRRALDAGADFVLLLNNDATLDPACLGELVRAAASGPRTAAVGAKVLSASDPTRVWATWGRITWRAALVELVGRNEPDDARFAALREVEWVPGCALLLARPALEDVGLLDEDFFAYHEDVDWCLRARARGWRVVFAPAARVVHRGEGSLAGRGRANPARYLSARNSVLVARKHAGAREALRLAVTVAASLPLEALRSWRRGEPRVAALLLRGYRDGLLGRDVPVRELGLR
jgi:GT2 family glycosyltransferase